MALPERQHFDIESAAEYLGCSVSDIHYYVEEGLLRHAVSTSHISDYLLIPLKDLSEELKEAIDRLYKPDLRQLINTRLDKRYKAIDHPGFLYLSKEQQTKLYDCELVDDERSWLFELLDGEPVTIWRDGSLHAEWIWRLVGKELGEIQLTREELDKLKPESELKPETVSDDATKKVWRFQLPNQADDIAIAIVDYGNRYIKEEKGHRPTLKDLQGYMLLVGRDSLQLKYDSKGKDYIFGDKPLSERAFRTRYKNYLISE